MLYPAHDTVLFALAAHLRTRIGSIRIGRGDLQLDIAHNL